MATHKNAGTAEPVKADGPSPKPAKRVDVELEAINAKNKQALSEALIKAQAVKIAPPLIISVRPPVGCELKKPAKTKKIKLVRDGFAMPEDEFAALATLKRRLAALGQAVKKSELIRGGVALLATLNDAELKAAMSRVERIKTGRPKK
jgi:hypothetical protein